MDRGSVASMGSQSSMGSQRNMSVFGDEDQAHKDDAMHTKSANESHPLRAGLFGVLYTLTKEKLGDSVRLAVVNALVEFVSIMTIMLQNKYPWSTDFNLWIWKIIWYITIQNPVSAWGLNLYLGIFYVFMILLLVVVGIGIWVAWCFKNNSFPFLWPIKFVRVVGYVFFTTFYIMSLNIYMVMLQCQPVDGVWVQAQFDNAQCFGFPFLIHLIVSVVGTLTFAGIALLLVMADNELHPLSRAVSGTPNSLCEIKSNVAKFLLTFVDICLLPWPKLQTVCLLLCLVPLAYWHLDMVPYNSAWINCLLGGFSFVYLWTAMCLTWLMYAVQNPRYEVVGVGVVYVWTVDNPQTTDLITKALGIGLLPCMLLGCCAAYARLYYLHRVGMKFLNAPPDVNTKRIHRFSNDMEAAIASRVCRVWDKNRQPLPEALDVGEAVLKAGQAQFPSSALLAITLANFLMDVRGAMASGWGQLDTARKMDPNLSFLFSIFVREQESKQKASVTQSGDGATDLVAYVELQRNFKLVAHYHRAALMATRDFWRLVLRDTVNFVELLKVFRRMDHMERWADNTYRSALDKYPNSVKLLRSYAWFLEEVKNDPWAAARYMSEADKQAEEVDKKESGIQMGTEDESVIVTSSSDAIITINAQGIIQLANKMVQQLLGFSKEELEGKNIKMIMPPFFAVRHDGYLRRYVATGKGNIVNTVRDVVAMHRDKYVFPVRLLVNKVSGVGADSMFMGVMKVVAVDPHVMRAWMLLDGTFMCVEDAFGDMTGWRGTDALGRTLSSLVVDEASVIDALTRVEAAVQAADDAQDLVVVDDGAKGKVKSTLPPGWEAGSVLATLQLEMKHKFADPVPCTVSLEISGSKDMRMILGTIRPVSALAAVLVLDSRGTVAYCNKPAASLWGYRDRHAMQGLELAALIAAPFGQLHQSFIKELKERHGRGRVPRTSCRAGLSQVLLTASGVHVHGRLAISSKDMDDAGEGDEGDNGGHKDHAWIIKAEPVSAEVALDERCLLLTLNAEGVVVSSGNSPATLFGWAASAALGQPLHALVDAFGQWHAEGKACVPALAALVQQSAERRGVSWRVAVHGLQQAGQAAEPTAGGAPPADGVTTSRSRTRAAIMQVEALSDGMIAVKLWRQDLICGVVEVNRHLVVTRADATAGLVFGVPPAEMHGRQLSKLLQLPKQLQLDDLLSHVSVNDEAGGKRGGLKRGAGAVGVRQTLEAQHDDGRPLAVVFQGVLSGSSQPRVVATVACANVMKGSAEALRRAVEGASGAVAAGRRDSSKLLLQQQAAGAGLAIRSRLALLRVAGGSTASSAAAAASALVPGDATCMALVQRSLVAARRQSVELSRRASVELSMRQAVEVSRRQSVEMSLRPSAEVPRRQSLEMMMARRQSVEYSAAARQASGLRASFQAPPPAPPGASDDVVAELLDGGSGAGVAGEASSDVEEREGRRDMDVSDSGSDRATATARKAALQDLEEDEARAALRGVRVAQRWLDTDYGEVGVADDDGLLLPVREPPNLPRARTAGAVASTSLRMPAEAAAADVGLLAGRSGTLSSNLLAAAASEELEEPPLKEKADRRMAATSRAQDGSGSASHSEATTEGDSAAGGGGDFRRGKRLKRVAKLVTSQSATQALGTLRWHLWALLALLLASHLACFVVQMLRFQGEQNYITNIAGAAEASERLHLAALYARCAEAAFSGYGFTTADLPLLHTALTAQLTRLTELQNSLYMGFTGQPTLRDASSALHSLWADAALLEQRQYHDTLPPEYVISSVGLFAMGNSFVANGKEVAAYLLRSVAANSSLSLSPAWLYLGDNGPGALYHGYLHLLNDLTLAAQSSVSSLQTLLLVLLLVEGAALCAASVAYVVFLSYRVARSRSALFMVFLAVPSGVARSMASKSVQLVNFDEEDGEEDEDQKDVVDTAGQADEDLVPSAAHGGGKPGSSKHIKDARNGPTAPEGKVPNFGTFGASSRKQQDLFHGKRLVETNSDVWRLCWPFLVWGVAVVVAYTVGYVRLQSVNSSLVQFKLVGRVQDQAARVMYYAAEVALTQDAAAKAAAQQVLLSEASGLQTVYNTSLYGGATLQDSAVDGAQDDGDGSLYTAAAYPQLLFQSRSCLRTDTTMCLAPSDAFYQSATHGLDMLVGRLALEANMLAHDALTHATPNQTRWQFVWQVGLHDLQEGLATLAALYQETALQAFAGQATLFIVVEVLAWLGAALFLIFILRPFLLSTHGETHLVAKLLSQLPPELDVESMIKHSWASIMQYRLDAGDNGQLSGKLKPSTSSRPATSKVGQFLGLFSTDLKLKHERRRVRPEGGSSCPVMESVGRTSFRVQHRPRSSHSPKPSHSRKQHEAGVGGCTFLNSAASANPAGGCSFLNGSSAPAATFDDVGGCTFLNSSSAVAAVAAGDFGGCTFLNSVSTAPKASAAAAGRTFLNSASADDDDGDGATSRGSGGALGGCPFRFARSGFQASPPRTSATSKSTATARNGSPADVGVIDRLPHVTHATPVSSAARATDSHTGFGTVTTGREALLLLDAAADIASSREDLGASLLRAKAPASPTTSLRQASIMHTASTSSRCPMLPASPRHLTTASATSHHRTAGPPRLDHFDPTQLGSRSASRRSSLCPASPVSVGQSPLGESGDAWPDSPRIDQGLLAGSAHRS